MALTFKYLMPEHHDAVLQVFLEQGMSRKKALKELKHDVVRMTTAIRDAHFTQPWRQLPDFMDPAHNINLTLLLGPNGVLVMLWLDGECKGVFNIGERYCDVEFLGVPTDDKPIEVGPTADVLPFKRRA